MLAFRSLKILDTYVAAQVKSMRFPMYTIPSDLLLQMTKIEPHEVLKAIFAACCLDSGFKK